MSNGLEFDADPGPVVRPRLPARAGGPSWAKLFTAVLAANLIAAVLILFAIRLYVYWSIADAARQMNERVHDPKK